MTLQRLALLFAWVKRVEAAGVMQITRKSLNWQGINHAARPHGRVQRIKNALLLLMIAVSSESQRGLLKLPSNCAGTCTSAALRALWELRKFAEADAYNEWSKP